MIRLLLCIGVLIGALLATGCEEEADVVTVSFGNPIDFTYACAGDGATFRPSTVTDADHATLCEGQGSGNLFGFVLNRNPSRLHVVQMNPESSDAIGVIDTDGFIPGFSGIPVGDAPLKLLRSDDWSSLYVLSSGARSLQRVVVHGLDQRGVLDYTLSPPVTLPGRPSTALVSGDTLWVASADDATVWAYRIGDSGALTWDGERDLPASIHQMQHARDALLITWVNHPHVSLVDQDFQILSEAALVAACSDGIDNDADGLSDAQDPDCRHSQDPSESGSNHARAQRDPLEAPTTYFAPEEPPCSDGIDNDGDGLTDAYDPSCADSPFGEWLPECADGIDNDGDGLSDAEDASCYGQHDTSESRVQAPGTYAATYIDGRDDAGNDYGQFVYVLDAPKRRLLVFSVDSAGQLSPVNVPALDTEVGALEYAGYGSGPGGTLAAIPRRALLGPAQAGEVGLMLGGLMGSDLSSGQLRGELWSRVIDDRTVPTSGLNWTPMGCDMSSEEGECRQPREDDATWYVFMPTLSGDIALIEAIRRGVPVHRYAQLTTAPESREVDVKEPVFVHRGQALTLNSARSGGAPLLGPTGETQLKEAVEGESPALTRSFGMWPAGYPDAVNSEGVASETWSLTYEGVLPETSGVLGRFIGPERFSDPGAAFCESGVAPGDWLSLEIPPSAVVEVCRVDAVVQSASGQDCPLLPSMVTIVDIPIVAVGQTTLDVDLSGAQSRPALSPLDEGLIEANPSLSSSECTAAWRAVDLEAQVLPLPPLSTVDLPRLSTYSVRPRAQWTVVGSRSGFLHDQGWEIDPETQEGSCQRLDDQSASMGRVSQRQDASLYATCPPSNEQLSHTASVPLYTPADEGRFTNFSFSLDVFEGCEQSDEGIVASASQRDMRWTFEIDGPDAPMVTAAHRINNYTSTVLHSSSVPVMTLTRQQVQLDSGGRRVHVLEIRANDLDHIATFE